MNRDFELIRKILFDLDNHQDIYKYFMRPMDEDYNNEYYHYRILVDAELIVEEHNNQYRMTWKGHDFLDSIRDPEIWRKTIEGADAAKGFTFDILRELAKGFLKTKIKAHTGIEI